MEAVAEHQLSVVLSSHLVSDLERVCDFLIVLVGSRVQLADDLDHDPGHPPPADRAALRPGADFRLLDVISASHTERQSTLVVRTRPTDRRPRVDGRPAPTLEDIVLAYMEPPRDRPRRPTELEVVR